MSAIRHPKKRRGYKPPTYKKDGPLPVRTTGLPGDDLKLTPKDWCIVFLLAVILVLVMEPLFGTPPRLTTLGVWVVWGAIAVGIYYFRAR